MPNAACPAPLSKTESLVTLADGEGGRSTRRIIEERILPRFPHAEIALWKDAASLPCPSGDIAFSTDSFVVSPLFFPGGDIGRLAVLGTTNDLAVAGARPMWISLALIMEEGLRLVDLERVLDSAAAAAREVGVQVVAGDTKVVPRGAADGLFINTAGIGRLIAPVPPGPAALEIGDEILVSGPIGQHGVAVLAAREQWGFQPAPTSDCASLLPAVEVLREAGIPLRAMRDATRGGVAAVLHEWSRSCQKTIALEEKQIPVTQEVRAVCELLGLDPLQVANEGTMVVAVAAGAGDAAVAQLQTSTMCSSGPCRLRAISESGVRRRSPRAWPRGTARRTSGSPYATNMLERLSTLLFVVRLTTHYFPDCVMSIRNLDVLFKPRSIAVIGASNQPHTVGYALWQNVSSVEFQGAVFPVNLKYDTVLGARAYRRVADLPQTVDLAIVAIPAVAVPAMIEEIAATGTRAVVIISAGFGETGVAGRTLEAELDRVPQKLRRPTHPRPQLPWFSGSQA